MITLDTLRAEVARGMGCNPGCAPGEWCECARQPQHLEHAGRVLAIVLKAVAKHLREADIRPSPDMQEFGDRHKIPEFASAVFHNARLACASELDALAAGGGR